MINPNNNLNQNMMNFNNINNNNLNSNINNINNIRNQNMINNNNFNSNIMMNSNNNNLNQNILLNFNNNNFNQNPIMNNNNLNNNQFIHPINKFNNNITMNNNNFPILNFGNNINNNNFQMNNIMVNDEEEWMKGFRMGVEEVVNSSSENKKEKMNVKFNTTKGYTRLMIVEKGTTIDQLLRKFLETEHKRELINDDKKLCFFYNGSKMKFGDNTKVEKLFKNNSSPKVVVIDVYHLIGTEYKLITFKTSGGKIFKFDFYVYLSVEDLLDNFFKTIGKKNLKGNQYITFVYNGKTIESFDLGLNVNYLIKNDICPTIIVIDTNNLI